MVSPSNREAWHYPNPMHTVSLGLDPRAIRRFCHVERGHRVKPEEKDRRLVAVLFRVIHRRRHRRRNRPCARRPAYGLGQIGHIDEKVGLAAQII